MKWRSILSRLFSSFRLSYVGTLSELCQSECFQKGNRSKPSILNNKNETTTNNELSLNRYTNTVGDLSAAGVPCSKHTVY